MMLRVDAQRRQPLETQGQPTACHPQQMSLELRRPTEPEVIVVVLRLQGGDLKKILAEAIIGEKHSTELQQ